MLWKYLKYFVVTYVLKYRYTETFPLRHSGLRSLKDFSKRGFSTVRHTVLYDRRKKTSLGISQRSLLNCVRPQGAGLANLAHHQSGKDD